MNQKIMTNLENIKDVKSDVREKAYDNLRLLFSDSSLLITVEDKNQLVKQLCSERFLFHGIKEGQTSKSVARSFSLLVLTLILSVDEKFQVDTKLIIKSLLKYIEEETDFRGKDEQLGWIHSLAHLGDLLSFLSFYKMISRKSIEKIAISIVEKIVSIGDELFQYGENERLVVAYDYILKESVGDRETILNAFKKNSMNSNIEIIYSKLQVSLSK